MATNEHVTRGGALRTVLVTVFLLLVGLAGLAAATDGFHAFTTETARRVAVRRHPVPLPDVLLENHEGEQYKLTDLKGQWVLLDFIYTRCLTFCSILGGEFAQLERQLDEPIDQGKLRFLSISFDPDHDGPAELEAYLVRFGNHKPVWDAARPLTADGLARIKRVFGLTVIPDGMGGYTHNAAILLVNPAGELVDIFDIGQLDQIKATLRHRLAS